MQTLVPRPKTYTPHRPDTEFTITAPPQHDAVGGRGMVLREDLVADLHHRIRFVIVVCNRHARGVDPRGFDDVEQRRVITQ